MSRSNNLAKNGGRKVVNEDELLTAIRQTLVERNLDEKLVEFDQESYADIQALSEFMSREVAAIIGPHGGAMMNHRWAALDTLVIEFFPTNLLYYGHWEETCLLNQTVIATRAYAGLEPYQFRRSCSRSISYCITFYSHCSI